MKKKNIFIIIFIIIFLCVGVGGYFLLKPIIKEKDNTNTTENTTYSKNLNNTKFFSDENISVQMKDKDYLENLTTQIEKHKQNEQVSDIVKNIKPDNIYIENVNNDEYSFELYNSENNSMLEVYQNSKNDVNEMTFVLKKNNINSINEIMPSILSYLSLDTETSQSTILKIKNLYNQFINEYGKIETYDSQKNYVIDVIETKDYFIGINITYDNGIDGKSLENIKIKLNKGKILS